MRCVIYDFETLGVDIPNKPALLSMAMLEYDEDEFTQGDGLDYLDLVNRAKYLKFDVVDQVKNHGRKIEKDTLAWWKTQGEEAKKVLDPSPDDVSITIVPSWIRENFPMQHDIKKAFTRGNNFDPKLLEQICNGDPFNWWALRDTRSYIDGMLIGTNETNSFMPKSCEEHFVHHDARHDVALDVMRMQLLVRSIILGDVHA